MARKRGPKHKQSKLVEVAMAAATAPATVITARERVNAFLLPVAWTIGAVGLMALVSCGMLAAVPEDNWPEALEFDHLPLYAVGSLAAASLLGWGCMQRGLGAVRRRIGWQVGGWLFVLLPVVCAGFVLAEGRWLRLEEWSHGRELGLFVRWYPAALVVLALGAFVLAELRSGGEEGAGWQRALWSLLLIAPYVLLMGTLVLGVEAPWLSETMQESLAELGSGAIVLQVAIGYFLSAGAASG